MASINPFYRFEDAIEVASIGQGAKTISFATYLLYTNHINTSYVGYTLEASVHYINGFLAQYNTEYQANFIAEIIPFPTPIASPSNLQVWIYDTNVVSLFPLLRISLVIERDSSGIITDNKVSFIGYLDDNFSYSPALFPGEMAAYRSLQDNNDTGSFLFPKWYKFDPATGIATSSVARFKDCKFDTSLGVSVRVNADIDPRGNRPMIKQNALDADGKYIMALFDSLIVSSQKPTSDWNSLVGEPDAWVLPAGYTRTDDISLSVYNRFQINIFKSGGQGFTLFMRENNGIMFQRFYAPIYSPFDFIANYSVSLPLPYETTSSDKKYGDVYYDFEFCEFPECSYPTKETYLMPIKTGDELKFNVHPYTGNIITETSVDIGLFDGNFNFVQKVGQSVMRTKMSWKMESFYTYLNNPGEINKTPQTLFITTAGNLDLLNSDYSLYANLPGESLLVQTIDIINAWIANLTIGTICFEEIDDPTYAYEVTWELPEQYSTGYLIGATGWIDSSPYAFVNTIYQEQSESIYQFQSDALIPSIAPGCYRFGLYRFETGHVGIQTTWPNQTIVGGSNYVFALCNPSGVAEYTWAIPNGISTWVGLCDWAKNNIPFAKTSIDPSTNDLTITICPYVALINWTLQIGIYNYSTGSLTAFPIDETADYDCGNASINEVYSFSNLLNLDNSDCFSTIIQFWTESNSIAEGFEYFDGWYQQVRLGINGGGAKPKLTESIYRQSNGVHKRPQSKQDLSVDLHTDFLDLETQLALVDATRHEQFVWNGRNIFVTGDIDVATIQDFSNQSSFEDLAQVKFSALVQGFQPKNSTCINC